MKPDEGGGREGGVTRRSSSAPRGRRLGVALLAGLAVLGGAHPTRPTVDEGRALAATAATPPGIAAPAQVVRELREALAQAIQRFEAKDAPGVLTHVSDRYWTGPLTKAAIRAQILALFQIYDVLQARVRIDDVRMVGEHAWVYSSGEVTGRLPILGSWMSLYGWERELEVARREGGAWRLYGYQQ
jgi:hypothetical protein